MSERPQFVYLPVEAFRKLTRIQKEEYVVVLKNHLQVPSSGRGFLTIPLSVSGVEEGKGFPPRDVFLRAADLLNPTERERSSN